MARAQCRFTKRLLSTYFALDDMGFVLNPRGSSWGMPALFWMPWVSAGWFVIALLLYKFAPSGVANALYIPIILCGAGAMLGGAIAAIYLFLGIWLPVRWGLGAAALFLNGAFVWFFVASLP